MHEERCEFSWWEDIKEMAIINLGAWTLYYTFGTSGKNCKKCRLMKKRKAI